MRTPSSRCMPRGLGNSISPLRSRERISVITPSGTRIDQVAHSSGPPTPM
jgi:hypothetical protein